MELLGLSLGLVVGILLGLLGGGGSILAVPIFVYLFGLDAKLAIATSLIVVGSTSFIGTIPHYRAGNVDLRRAAIFIVGSTVGAFVGSQISVYLNGATQLVIFASVMLCASYFMLRRRTAAQAPTDSAVTNSVGSTVRLLIQACCVGVITGIVGVGGGFMIVPTLVLLSGVDMKRAVGTSLLVIGLNSMSAFTGYLLQPNIREAIRVGHIAEYSLIPFLLLFMLITYCGVFVGSALSTKIEARILRRVFGWFLVIVSLLILLQNVSKFR